MGILIASVGLFVLLGGLLGIASPPSLRLRRQSHALAVAAGGFIMLVVGQNLDMAPEKEREQAERAAMLAEETEAERALRVAAYEAQRAAIPAPRPPSTATTYRPGPRWTLNTDSRGYRSAVQAGNARQLYVSVLCRDRGQTVALARQPGSASNLLIDGVVEALWNDGTVDRFQDDTLSPSQIRSLIGKIRRLSTVTFNVTSGRSVSDTIDLSGSSTLIGSLDCASGPSRPRPRRPPVSYVTTQEFASRLTWNDMEPIGVFADRMPAGVTGGAVGRIGETRRFRYNFPGGGAIIMLARACGGARGGLCVWAVDVE